MPGLALVVGTMGGPSEDALWLNGEAMRLVWLEELAWATPSFWGALARLVMMGAFGFWGSWGGLAVVVPAPEGGAGAGGC